VTPGRRPQPAGLAFPTADGPAACVINNRLRRIVLCGQKIKFPGFTDIVF